MLSMTVQDVASFLQVAEILFWNETLHIPSDFKKCVPVLLHENRREEFETREEEILKALEHH